MLFFVRCLLFLNLEFYFNPFTLTSDHDNFSLQYQYNIKQIGDENREEYQLWDY